MTVKISHTADIQAFFNKVAGLDHAEGNLRFKQIILRVLQDTARLVEDLEITEDEFWHAIDYLNRLGAVTRLACWPQAWALSTSSTCCRTPRMPRPA